VRIIALLLLLIQRYANFIYQPNFYLFIFKIIANKLKRAKKSSKTPLSAALFGADRCQRAQRYSDLGMTISPKV